MKDIKELDLIQKNIERIEKGAFLIAKATDRMNVMTIGWYLFGYMWRKPVMMVAVRNTRFTHGIIDQADSFSVSIPTGDMKKELAFCGAKSGKDFDKFEECNLKTIKSKVNSPILDIPGYHYQCRIIYKSPMNLKFLIKELEPLYAAKEYHTLYFGEIVACSFIE